MNTVGVVESLWRYPVKSMSGEHNPDFLHLVARAHDASAGVYCAVLVEGTLAQGDPIQLLDQG